MPEKKRKRGEKKAMGIHFPVPKGEHSNSKGFPVPISRIQDFFALLSPTTWLILTILVLKLFLGTLEISAGVCLPSPYLKTPNLPSTNTGKAGDATEAGRRWGAQAQCRSTKPVCATKSMLVHPESTSSHTDAPIGI